MKDVLINLGIQVRKFRVDPESRDYGACAFDLGENKVVGRRAKITPTKTGQFVTLWKRLNDGPIQPFDASDDIDFFVVLTQTESESGYFKFPKAVLIERGVVAGDDGVGKRALRVYPPWDKPTSRQALKTQAWQAPYFVAVK